ncbi:ATP-binding cassette domain-containing protein [Altererythrobacter sp.]|uniref:ABC transporter ATP-binding protein n=1 Tax=Altererythrobacter sp. TaxID=1872480 RepID=UPI001B267B62|nr:ATP-binding cassette domain-containing protein [Altererythrobacter sp.]MDX1703886.1 ATP-binding cassette domain-containing protein [Altererythrobacter ishigakiensis]MBO6608762.1 ATP-binding cassette domain-containing protein [Altererythrobacter sp.]MBO6640802.1 ATP-binding cassette domain-containing protein [Altererythrobacter sp.]MBO6708500.1 ATP-binding cassette domain-containing protein [Altererythrobacter sp.]MBO6945364.1 ATP-binding cassette domain-containing protein [Altererythrobacte
MSVFNQHEPSRHERFRGEHPIVVEGLKTAFGDHVVHEDLSLRVNRGEIIGVVGGSGSGKSVLMRAIIGLQTPAAGEIEVFGNSITQAGIDEDLGVRSRWGVLFQGGALFSTLTVGENVEVPIKQFYPDIEPELRREIARYKVILSGLPENAIDKFPSELSGGMKKRAGLARALALDPELLFLDEPTAGLDPIGAAAFDKQTRELKETLGLTVFLITHDLDTLYEICDRVAVIADKRIIAVGTIPELIETNHPWIDEYFNGPRGRSASHGKLPQGNSPTSVDNQPDSGA